MYLSVQAWLLLNDLAGDDATAGMDVDVVSFLRHSMVDKWLCAEMTREGVMAGVSLGESLFAVAV